MKHALGPGRRAKGGETKLPAIGGKAVEGRAVHLQTIRHPVYQLVVRPPRNRLQLKAFAPPHHLFVPRTDLPDVDPFTRDVHRQVDLLHRRLARKLRTAQRPVLILQQVAQLHDKRLALLQPHQRNKILAGLALLLGSVGIYGVMSFSVAQRTQELGVRIALGADRRSVFVLVLSRAALLTVPGIVIGLLLALASARMLSGLLYEVGAQDPATYVGVSVVLLLVAAGASFLPAYRATRVNPMESMREG